MAMATTSSLNVGAVRTSASPPSRRSVRVCCVSEEERVSSRREATTRLALAAAICTTASFSSLAPAAAAAAAAEEEKEEEVKLVMADSGIGFCDMHVGLGPPVVKGCYVKVNYTSMLHDGTEFENSYTLHRPITFRLGVGEVIDGWDQGILGGNGIPPMLPGGKRRLQVPASLAFGEEGVGCKKRKSLIRLIRNYINRGKSQEPQSITRPGGCFVPPNETLMFDVEIVEAFELPKNIREAKLRK